MKRGGSIMDAVIVHAFAAKLVKVGVIADTQVIGEPAAGVRKITAALAINQNYWSTV